MAGSLQGWSWELISGYKEPFGVEVTTQTIFLTSLEHTTPSIYPLGYQNKYLLIFRVEFLVSR